MRTANRGLFTTALCFLLVSCTSEGKRVKYEPEADRDGIEKVVGEHMKELRACYYQTLETNPASEGALRMLWDVDAGGKATGTRMEIITAKRGLEAIGPCLIDRIGSWQFPKPNQGETPSVSYPLFFSENGKLNKEP